MNSTIFDLCKLLPLVPMLSTLQYSSSCISSNACMLSFIFDARKNVTKLTNKAISSELLHVKYGITVNTRSCRGQYCKIRILIIG